MADYTRFLERKAQLGGEHGVTPKTVPGFLFDFQAALLEWAQHKGRAAIFADCGLGKTPIQLVWADNVGRRENKSVLILCPLAVSAQTIREAEKFGIEALREISVTAPSVYVASYEKLHHIDPDDFAGVVCDESSILKSFDGKRKAQIPEFMRLIPHRLLATATAAPNDYIELGTSSEALGYLGHLDMLQRFFKNEQNKATLKRFAGKMIPKWRLKGHAQVPFWQWVCSWARAMRKPSDLGFDDGPFILPELVEEEYTVKNIAPASGMLFTLPAVGLDEQRDERRRTIKERCEFVANLVNDTGEPALVWCHLNAEGDLLEELIPDCVQVAGRHSDDHKEEKLTAFAENKVRVLVTKPKIGGWGLNLQHCAHVTFFPSHSYEQYYQGVRRCWRFGQKRPVKVDVICTEGERLVMDNLRRKATAADKMFTILVAEMERELSIDRSESFPQKEEVPPWLSSIRK
jgi:hypothetical protein